MNGSDPQPDRPEPNRDPKAESFPDGTQVQKIAHDPVAARVPERVSRGVFSTGVLVLEGPGEFVLDFLQAVARPYQIVGTSSSRRRSCSNSLQPPATTWESFRQTLAPPPSYRDRQCAARRSRKSMRT